LFVCQLNQTKELLAERIMKKDEDLRRAEEEAGTAGEDGEKRKRFDALVQEAKDQAEMKRNVEEELKAAMGPYRQLDREIESVRKSKKAAENMLHRSQKTLEETRAKILAMADSAESEEARCTAQLKKSEEEMAEARSKVDELKQEQTNWFRAYEEIEPHVRDATSKVASHTKQLEAVQYKLQTLQSSDGQDLLALLGPRVATVANIVGVQRHCTVPSQAILNNSQIFCFYNRTGAKA
jgi:chromosome segregation ATPase